MITKYLNKIYFLLGFILIFSSCTNDLNVLPKDDDEFLSHEFYAQPTAYKQALAGIYGNLALTGATGPESSNLSHQTLHRAYECPTQASKHNGAFDKAF